MTTEELATLVKRIQAKGVTSHGGCVIWTGMAWSPKDPSRRYGYIKHCGKKLRVHRIVFLAEYGPLPSGTVPDHLCRNTLCINPLHMEAVTARENTLRGIGPTAINARKTMCNKGHPLHGDNVWLRPNTRERWCRTCMRARRSAYGKRRRTLLAALEGKEGPPK